MSSTLNTALLYAGAAPAACAGDLAVACYRGVPPFAGPALERLYGNLFASLPQFELSMGLDGAHTFVLSRGQEQLAVLLFRLAHGRVTVFNEVIRLPEREIAAFCDYVFAHYAQAQVIVFRAVGVEPARRRWPCQQYDYLEDTVIDLPSSVEAYTASLGKNARRNVRRYQQAAQQDWPSLAFQVWDQDQVDADQVRAIIELNRARMASKNKLSDIDQHETENILQLVRHSGLVGVITIDGRVCAGAISCRTGNNYFLMVLAHEPAFDRYSLGFLCCYLTICACIARGGREFHFLWGRYDYKLTFLGQVRRLDHLLVYRSRLAQLGQLGLALAAWRHARLRRLTMYLQQAKRSDRPWIAPAMRLFERLRAWRLRHSR